jgi:Na+-translocating ferredoxin:NAD+ oxidoreductase RnfG subunit
MDRRTPFLVLPLAALAASPACYAVQYLSVEQAQILMFPDSILTAAPLTLTDAQKQEIEQRSGMKVRQTTLKRWRAANGGYFVLDQVLGKHEFITYAVALDSAGAVRQIEILDYRETHGDEVRRAAWRHQFTGKTSRDTLRINEDIQNISGATLSCVHITDGIRRLLITHDVVMRQP